MQKSQILHQDIKKITNFAKTPYSRETGSSALTECGRRIHF